MPVDWVEDGTLIRRKANGEIWCIDEGDADKNAHIQQCSKTNTNRVFIFTVYYLMHIMHNQLAI